MPSVVLTNGNRLNALTLEHAADSVRIRLADGGSVIIPRSAVKRIEDATAPERPPIIARGLDLPPDPDLGRPSHDLYANPPTPVPMPPNTLGLSSRSEEPDFMGAAFRAYYALRHGDPELGRGYMRQLQQAGDAYNAARPDAPLYPRLMLDDMLAVDRKNGAD